MSGIGEQPPDERQPVILETEINEEGSHVLRVEGARGQDVIATIRYHEPDEETVRFKLTFLFDRCVEQHMFDRTTHYIVDPAQKDLSPNVVLMRMVHFKPDVTVDEVDEVLLAAHGRDKSSVEDTKICLLKELIDNDGFPFTFVTLESKNEYLATDEETLASEMAELIDKHYGFDTD